ncbi:hypothetical protein BS47DRAFT_288079 [Hydnum rufescens UP504]|uniref:Transmembrane protein n=1 Tax=Hydnum rufescens UP504 TaxID=1448309 RepID=A0A9P6ALR0_9AGAM|nr:hypothetical protein BS47DRAFT_288079 [Hydnum rufescens UP504]
MISIIVPVGVLIAQLLTAPPVQAQTSNSENSLGQNPCLQAAWLQAECNDGSFRVDTIPPTYHYIGPTSDNTTENACICTTVVYNLMAACGACQNLTYITLVCIIMLESLMLRRVVCNPSWTSWSFYCIDYRSVAEGTYNVTIPYGTSIPAWAYDLPSNHNDTFNIPAAKNIGDSPERTGSILSPTATSTYSLSDSLSYSLPYSISDSLLTGFPFDTTLSSSPTQSQGGGGSSSNVGAIAGGVAGGVVGLGLIALVGFLLLRKRSAQPPPKILPSQNSDGVLISPTSPGFSGANGGGGTTLNGSGPEMLVADNRPMSFPSVYDPNDPSTYPTTPIPSPSQTTGPSHPSFPTPPLERDPAGKYSGVPEL